MLKIQVPAFGQQNNHFVKHAFFCGLKRTQSLSSMLKANFALAPFFLPKQTHSDVCTLIDEKSSLTQHCDAIVTKRTDIMLCVCTADCVPIILSDCDNKLIAVVHSGWRGAKSGIIENTIKKMIEIGSSVENISAVIGPAIAKKNYAVGHLFYEDFIKDESQNKKFFLNNQETLFFDIISYVKSKLCKLGIKVCNIYDCEVDTYSNFGIASYRRFKDMQLPNDSTNVAVVMLKSDKAKACRVTRAQEKEWLDIPVKKIHSKKIVQNYSVDSFLDIKANYLDKDSDNVAYDPDNLYDTESEQDGSFTPQESEEQKIIKKIKKGKIQIEKTLDMHGMTEEVAYNALCSFIDKAFLEGLRCLLVIVGKGKRGAGVIKSNFRDWIESDIEFSRRVMMIKESLPHHGGSGAYYIFLRRQSK